MLRMRVRVEFIGQLREAAGCSQTTVYIENGSNILDLLKTLVERYGARFEERVFAIGTANEVAEDLSMLLNGKILSKAKVSSTELMENDTVVLMPEVII